MVVETSLTTLILQQGWLDIPQEIVSREGKKIQLLGDVWHLPYTTRGNATLNFERILRDEIRWITKKYIIHRLQLTSTHAGYSAFQDIWREFLRSQEEFELNNAASMMVAKEKLISLIEKVITKARAEHRLWALYRAIQWYIWCAENYPELGFCSAYAMELEGMVMPGNPKGEAVRMEDPDSGPLHRSLELPLLIKAMREDNSEKFEHLQQKAALALSIALGRNPANLTYLKESDLVNLTPNEKESCYIIRMPRIKKRQLNPRDDLLDEYLDEEFARYLMQLIEANKEIQTTAQSQSGIVKIEKPLFISLTKNHAAIASGVLEDSFNMTSEDISSLLKSFVSRHNIISPLTGKQLHISTRRLRYTLATGLAAEGISTRELARIHDHTDTQHVQVYFELAGTIVEHLDKAVAKGFAKYLNLFKGTVINNASEAINGDRDDKHLAFINESKPTEQTEIGICGQSSICHLDPPFSCYLCPKFQPYKHADHEYVLECLLESRNARMEKYENARLGIQLDQVIVAVAQVAELCKQEQHKQEAQHA